MWEVQELRFTTIWARPEEPIASPLENWQSLTGTEARNIQIQGSGLARKVFQEGKFKQWQLKAEIQAGRFDWHVVPDSPQEPAAHPPRVAGPFPLLSDQFRSLIIRWLESQSGAMTGVNRLAFAPHFVHAFPDRANTLEFLNSLIPEVCVDKDDTVDFEFTTSTRMKSGPTSGQIPINTVKRWACVKEVTGAIKVSANTPHVHEILQNSRFLASLMLDVNNVPARTPFAPENLQELAMELFKVVNIFVVALKEAPSG